MTKTAMEMRKLATQKEMQDKEHSWKSAENRKDRRKDYITKGMDVAGKLLTVRKNDPAWYKRYLKDLDKFTNVPTYRRLGVPFRSGSYTSTDPNTPKTYAIPGILTYHYVDTVGPQFKDANRMSSNPVNQILMRSKEQVLKSNSRSSVNWEAADLGLNIFASASILTALGEYKRLILCAQTYSATNAYLGLGLLQALGFSADGAKQFITDLAAHRKNYMILAQRFNNAIVAPADLTLFRRKWYLATNVFADNTDPSRPQLFVFKDDHYYLLSPDGSKLGSTLSTIPGLGTGSVVSHIFNMISNMISSIVDNPDYQEMYADLRSAIAGNILQVEEGFNENDTISFNTDDLNREQIRNIKTMPAAVDVDADTGVIELPIWNADALDIVSDESGYLYQGAKTTETNVNERKIHRYSTLTMSSYNVAQVAAAELHFEYSSSSPRHELYNVASLSNFNGDTVLEITRFKFNADISVPSTNNGKIQLDLTDCGTEVITYGTISTYSDDPQAPFITDSMCTCVIANAAALDADAYYYFCKNIALYSAFDWAPCVRMYYVPTNLTVNSTNPPVCHFGDMTNTFSIGNEELISINQACVLSELYLDTSSFKR